MDQATTEAVELVNRLGTRPELVPLRDALAALSGIADASVAISTLRGEREDNGDWAADPACPAIVVGTVDMVGSRLLFSGYGDSRYWRARHAGLVGQDSVIVNDEAHLTPAFANLLTKVRDAQRGSEYLKPFSVVKLSATHPTQAELWPKSLQEDSCDESFRRIFSVCKELIVHRAAGTSDKDRLIWDLAIGDTPGRTLIFVREPEEARRIADQLRSRVRPEDAARILTLTGTMRGFERDELVRHPIFAEFEQHTAPLQSCWMVATSAGEVGINISAERLITDLDTLDHLLQRFGRLARFGESAGIAHVLVAKEDLKDEHKVAALAWLENLPKANGRHDISPASLFGRELNSDACSPTPLIAPLHPWHLDVWGQTTLGRHPARPAVEPWLHGKEKTSGPETMVAWRSEVADLISANADDRESVLQKYPVLAHERLTLPVYRLQAHLASLADSDDERRAGVRLLCRSRDGGVSVMSLDEAAARENASDLAYAQLILPPGCGSLENGMFSPTWVHVTSRENDSLPRYDVAGLVPGMPAYDDNRASYRIRREEGVWTMQRLGDVPAESKEILPLVDAEMSTLQAFAREHDWRLVACISTGEDTDTSDNAATGLVAYFIKTVVRQRVTERVLLQQHTAAVAEVAERLAMKLALPGDVVTAFRVAGELHDRGKSDWVWQMAAGNHNLKEPVAKPLGVMRGRSLGGFRHELSSLVTAAEELAAKDFSEDVRELALHLIASHHGHARPCFEVRAFSKHHGYAKSSDAAHGATLRFARMQRRFGLWGLAYLESVFMAADGLVSAQEQEQPNHA